LQNESTELKRTPTIQEADAKITNLRTQIATTDEKLRKIADRSAPLPSAAEMTSMKSTFAKHYTNWKRYLRAANEMIGMLSESTNQKRSEIVSELGIETDEDANTSAAEFEDLHKSCKTRT